jgi:hypothetical protein
VLLSGPLPLGHLGWAAAARGRGRLYLTCDSVLRFPGRGAEAGANSAEFAERIIHHLNLTTLSRAAVGPAPGVQGEIVYAPSIFR